MKLMKKNPIKRSSGVLNYLVALQFMYLVCRHLHLPTYLIQINVKSSLLSASGNCFFLTPSFLKSGPFILDWQEAL